MQRHGNVSPVPGGLSQSIYRFRLNALTLHAIFEFVQSFGSL